MDFVAIHMRVEDAFPSLKKGKRIRANVFNRVKNAVARAFSVPTLATAVA